jgi:hypothetical protein
MSSERAGVHTGGTLNREKARERLLNFVPSQYVDKALDALEACVVPDPRIARIKALSDERDADPLEADPIWPDEIRSILLGA